MALNGRERRTTTEGTTLRTPLTRLLLTVTTAVALAACSGEQTPAADETAPPSTSPSSTAAESSPAEEPTADGTVIEITIHDDSVEPSGDRVEIPLGEPVTFDITADRAGELHVHATPEEEIAFRQGDSETELTFDKPGVVDVEDHETGDIIVQLQVS
jgi:plastocyanin